MTDAETTKSVPPAFPEEAPEAGSGKMISAMGAIGLIAGILIVFTYQVTFPFIQDNKARLLEKAIFEVVPGAATKRVFTVDAAGKVTEVAEADPKQLTLYACYKSGGGLAGVALEGRFVTEGAGGGGWLTLETLMARGGDVFQPVARAARFRKSHSGISSTV